MTYIKNAFAVSGDRTEPPYDDPADGSVSYETGYGAQYSQDPTSISTARRIERLKMNGLFYRLSLEVQRLQQQGYPDWIPPSENDSLSFPYVKGATVRYEITSGVFGIFRSLIDNNTNVPTDTTTWYNLDILRPVFLSKSADYTITTTDNASALGMITGGADKTFTLPDLGASVGRMVTMFKEDAAAGNLIIAAAGSDTIQGASSKTLYGQYDYITLLATTTTWYILEGMRPSGLIEVRQAVGHGSTNTHIRRLSASATYDINNLATYTVNSTDGSSFTMLRDALVSITYRDRGSGLVEIGISKNSNQLTTTISSINEDHRLAMQWNAATYYTEAKSVTKLVAGDVIRPHDNGALSETTGAVLFRMEEVQRFS